MAHPNEELLRQGTEAFSRGDMDAVAALLADDIVFHVPGRSQLAGDHQGKDQVLSLFARQVQLTGGTFRLEMHDVVANDEHGVVLTRTTAEREGKTLDALGVLVFHLRDGKVTEVWVHPYDEYAGDEFFS